MEIILTGRKVPAAEALRSACANRSSNRTARAPLPKRWPAHCEISQAAVRADRRSVLETYGVPLREACAGNANGVEAHFEEGAAGAARFGADWAVMVT